MSVIRDKREDDEEIGWSTINEEVDTVIPLLLQHLQKLGIEHLQLPDINENLTVVIWINYNNETLNIHILTLHVSEASSNNVWGRAVSNKWYRLQFGRNTTLRSSVYDLQGQIVFNAILPKYKKFTGMYVWTRKKSMWLLLVLHYFKFEYNFLLKLMALEGYGKVIGSLEDTIIYAELAIDIVTFKMKLYDFRVIQFR